MSKKNLIEKLLANPIYGPQSGLIRRLTSELGRLSAETLESLLLIEELRHDPILEPIEPMVGDADGEEEWEPLRGLEPQTRWEPSAVVNNFCPRHPRNPTRRTVFGRIEKAR